MGSIISKIADEIKLHGSFEAWRAWEEVQERRRKIPGLCIPSPPPAPPPKFQKGGVMSQSESIMPITMKIHELKTWPAPFKAVWEELKPFEIRLNDRDFEVGDLLRLREWDPGTEEFSGRNVWRKVTYILSGTMFGIQEGFVIMAMKPANVPAFYHFKSDNQHANS